MAETVTRNTIERSLRDLGLAQGDVVVVHASLSSFGEVEGGAAAVVDALLEVLGNDGTLVAPTYSPGTEVFEAASTPSICGAITEEARTRPDAVRSLHPTHSVAAIGSQAQAITEGHEKVHAFGRGSALFKVLQARGKVLLLGAPYESNSMVHVAEEIAGAPYLDRSRQVQLRTRQDKVVRRWIRRPGCSLGFGVVGEALEDAGAVLQTWIGGSLVRLMSARAVVDVAIEAIGTDPEALLCEEPDCGQCAEARAMLVAMEVERQDQEVIELAEQEERTIRLIERQLGGSPVKPFDPEDHEHSPN